MTIEEKSENDLRAMTKEQLKEYIEKQNSINDEIDEETQENHDQSNENEEEINNIDEEKNDNDYNVEEDQQKTEKEDLPKNSDTDELLKIIREQSSMINRVSDELNLLKKQRETKPAEKENQEEEDYGQYEKSDVEYIKSLISKEFGNLTKRQQEAKEKEKEESFKSNQEAFNELQKDQALFVKLKPILDEEFKNAGREAVYKKNWVSDKITEAMIKLVKSEQKATIEIKPKDNLDSKKKQASTVSSGGTTNSGKSNKVDIDKMSSQEYLEYIQKTMGIKKL